jgi:16S rRNA processing protein RimM
MTSAGFLAVGRIIGAHGIRGELKVQCYLDDLGQLLDQDELTFELPGESTASPHPVEEARPHKGVVLVKLQGIETRNAAEELVGREVFLPEDRMPPVPAGSFKLKNLLGLAVIDGKGHPRGRVQDVDLIGAQGIVTVVLEQGGLVMMPFVGEYVGKVDLESATLRVTEAFERLLAPEEVGR